MGIAAPHNQPTRGHHCRLWRRVLTNLLDLFVTVTTKETHTNISFPPEWSHTQDRHITEKRTGQLEWEYAITSENIYDALTHRAGSDDIEDEHPDTTSTTENHQGRIRAKETDRRGEVAAWYQSPSRHEATKLHH